MLSAAALACVLVAAPAAVTAAEWRVVSIEDYGAKGDNKTDNTAAFRSALKAVQAGGGEVLVPGPASRIFQTAPINLTSNVVLRVEGTMRAVPTCSSYSMLIASSLSVSRFWSRSRSQQHSRSVA